ncbi:hypothetical protein [Corynebacterium glutamicum]|nr:hypothetical protein [Corynebacterium glutamicum]
MNINNYVSQMSWSEDDQEFLAMVAEVPSPPLISRKLSLVCET